MNITENYGFSQTQISASTPENRVKPWTLSQLVQAMAHDLTQCQTALERSMVKAICGREIRQKAHEFAQHRKLTPGEIAIAEQFGFPSI